MKRKCLRLVSSVLILVIAFVTFGINAFAREKSDTPNGIVYELDEKGNYNINESTSQFPSTKKNTVGTLSIIGDYKNQGGGNYYVQNGNINISYTVNKNNLKLYANEWHIVDDNDKKIDDVRLNDKILKGAIIVQSSIDGIKWFEDKIITDAFSKEDSLSNPIFTTKDIHQLNGCYYRIIVVYKLEKQIESSQVLFWEKEEFEYMKIAEVYSIFVINQQTVDNGAASPNDKPRKEFNTVINTGKDNGYDISQATIMDKDDPHFSKSIGYFTVNGYTRETTDKDGIPTFLKTTGDNIVMWFSLKEDINNLFGNGKLSVSEDKNGYDKAMEVEQTNFKHGALIIKYTDEEGHSPETVKYFDFLAANTMTGADTRIQLYEEGDYEVSLDYEIHNSSGLGSYHNYKINFKFNIRNGNTMAFPRDAKTGAELKDGAWTEDGFTIDLAESKYLTIDFIRKEIIKNADGTISAGIRANKVGKENAIYSKQGIYEITVKNQYSEGSPTTVIIYVGNDKYILALAKNRISIEKLNELIKLGIEINEDGTLENIKNEQQIEANMDSNDDIEITPQPTESIHETPEPIETATIADEKSVSPQNDENLDANHQNETNNESVEKRSPALIVVICGLIVAGGILVTLKMKKIKKEK